MDSAPNHPKYWSRNIVLVAFIDIKGQFDIIAIVI